MKKLALALTICASLGAALTLPTTDANAGVVTMLRSARHLGTNPTHAVSGVVMGGLVAWGGFILTSSPSTTSRVLGIVLIILDANQELRQDAIEDFLSQRYTFIDDREAISNLASLVKTNIQTSGGLTQEMNITIPADQVRNVLANSSLNSAQVDQIVADLN